MHDMVIIAMKHKNNTYFDYFLFITDISSRDQDQRNLSLLVECVVWLVAAPPLLDIFNYLRLISR